MRRYDIVTGILLILSIVDFALAAPLLVQEKLHARVGVANAHKNVRTVSGKRWDEELEKLGEEYFKTSGKSIDSSGTHSSSTSSPAPSESDHGSANVVQPPAPDLASSTTNPDSLTELSCLPASSSSTPSMQGLRARGGCLGVLKLLSDPSFKPFHTFNPMHVAKYDTTYSDYRDSDHEFTVAKAHTYASQPNLNSRPQIDPSADPDFDWDYWMNAEDPQPPPTPPRPARPKVPNGQTSGHGPGPPPTGPEPSWPVPPPTEFYSITVGPSPFPDASWLTKHEHEMVAEPPTSPDSELHLDHQSLSAGSAQPEDFQAAIYEAKGKAKESRGISGTARDVGNAAHWQKEVQPAERSLNPTRGE